jgi:hypothetical protein
VSSRFDWCVESSSELRSLFVVRNNVLYIAVCLLSVFRAFLSSVLMTCDIVKSDTACGCDLCIVRGIDICTTLKKQNAQYCSLYIYICY